MFCVFFFMFTLPQLLCFKSETFPLDRAQDSTLYDELNMSYADYIPLHLAQLKVLDESKVR